MPNGIFRETIIDRVKREILLGRLELNEVGVTMDDLKNDVPLLEEEGLDLDSVDALDIIVSIQQMFGFRIENIDRDFILTVCRDINSIADYVYSQCATRERQNENQ
jgi:acyl carrier protein